MSIPNNTMSEGQQTETRKITPLWQNRDYLLLWGGQIISTSGSMVSQLAFPLLVLALTHSPAQAGSVSALRTIPYLVLSLPAGALVDRWNRKRVMIICDLGRCLSMASIPVAVVLGHLSMLQLYLVSLIEGTLFVFFDLAEVASLPQVIAKEQIPAATAQNIATYNISALLGSPLGGVLYSIGQLFPFLFDAISYLGSVLSLLFIRTSFQKERSATPQALWTEVKEGLKWLWEHPLFRFLALVLCGINILTAGGTLIVIVLGQHLHASSVDLGLIFSVAGIAGILGSMAAPMLRRRFSFFTTTVSALWPQALLMPLLILAPNLFVLGAILALILFFAPIFDITQRSQRITMIPDELQGRVNSVYRLIVFSGQPVGLALTGLLLQTIGATPAILLMGAGFSLIALLATLNLSIRQVDA
jgi:predicted MFS family arabinose efflux permease